MDNHKLDAVAQAIIAEAESHMEWVDSRHLRTTKDIRFFSDLFANQLERVSADLRSAVVERLVSFGQCLDTEFDSHDVSLTFMAGLRDAVDDPLPPPHETPHPTGWTFKTRRGGGIKFETRLKVRGPGGGTLGC